ncbi:hypothetical protein HNQ51_000264 [Inhella inkyongensis]|uniref:Uncharacterized protein n=1 Tax=Inhella inkyongensis TaxID=392593 RepID=A0A840S2R1_9BURK|nr:hypothetical protein [Inhella inkyongensis]MBB5202971.1 hypothetical protein [Inhella inkyongensis]
MPYTLDSVDWMLASAAGGRAANSSISRIAKPQYLIDDCYEIETASSVDSAERLLDPILGAKIEYRDFGANLSLKGAAVSVIVPPKHGKLVLVTQSVSHPIYRYDPNDGFIGIDRVEFLVALGGKSFRVRSELKIVELRDEHEGQGLCPTGSIQKVSTAELALPGTRVAFMPMGDGMLGQSHATASGRFIALAPDAAGHGGYRGRTPVAITPFVLSETLAGVPKKLAAASPESVQGFMAVLAQERAKASEPIYLESCIAVDSSRPMLGSANLSPDSALTIYFRRFPGDQPEHRVADDVRIRVLKEPKHGVVSNPPRKNGSNSMSNWRYRSIDPNREGPDEVVFEVINQGKTYVVTLYLAHVPVTEGVSEEELSQIAGRRCDAKVRRVPAPKQPAQKLQASWSGLMVTAGL